METHRDLRVWQQSVDFASAIYLATKSYPRDELFGLVSQMRRAAVSVPSNIAEWYARGSEKDKLRFIRISSGSMSELETQLVLSHKFDYLDDISYNQLIEMHTNVWKQLNALITSIKKKLCPQDLPFNLGDTEQTDVFSLND